MMRQLKAGERHSWRTGTTGKQAQLGPARELRGSIEHCGTSSASSAFCTNSRPLCAPAPPAKNIACAERRFHHTCRPRSGRKFSTDGQKVHSKLKKDAEKGSGKRAKWPGRPYLQCLGPLGLPVGMLALVMALGVLLQCHSSWPVAAVSLHTAAAAISVQAAAAAIAAAATRDASASLSDATNTYMSLGSDFGLAGLALQAQLRGPPNPAFRDGQPRMSCIYVLGAPPRLHRYKARMVDHPGSLVSE